MKRLALLLLVPAVASLSACETRSGAAEVQSTAAVPTVVAPTTVVETTVDTHHD